MSSEIYGQRFIAQIALHASHCSPEGRHLVIRTPLYASAFGHRILSRNNFSAALRSSFTSLRDVECPNQIETAHESVQVFSLRLSSRSMPRVERRILFVESQNPAVDNRPEFWKFLFGRSDVKRALPQIGDVQGVTRLPVAITQPIMERLALATFWVIAGIHECEHIPCPAAFVHEGEGPKF